VTETVAGPKRMSREARRDQLERVAMRAIARHGVEGRLMEEVGEAAGVTRNLLYHYFPRGRADLVLAAVRRAGHEILTGWETDASVPLQERLTANTAHALRHALGPSDAWLTLQRARGSADAQVRAVVRDYVEEVVDTIAANNHAPPTPLERSAIRGFIAFAEAVLDDARRERLPPDEVEAMLRATLTAALAPAR
jgi:AcrR family transcriptional regulator